MGAEHGGRRMADDVGEDLDKGLVGDVEVLVAPAVQNRPSVDEQGAGHFGGESCLADSWLAADEQELAAPGRRCHGRPTDQLALGRPADEGPQAERQPGGQLRPALGHRRH